MSARRRPHGPERITHLDPQAAAATSRGQAPAPSRPVGEQAMGAALYRRIREVVRRLSGDKPPRNV